MFLRECTSVHTSQPFKVATADYGDLYVWGTFGGATVKLQLSPEGKEWFDVPDYTVTARTLLIGRRFSKGYLRWVVTDATGSTNVNAALVLG